MSIVVEDGTGLADAESYASVEFADDYHLTRGREETWVELDEVVKEQALRLASDYMVQEYRDRWAGYRRTLTQALDWPRWDVPRRDAPGWYGAWRAFYDSNVVPEEVKRACVELAFRAVDQDTLTVSAAGLLPDLEPQVQSESVGPISVTYFQGGRQQTRRSAVDAMLLPLLSSGRGTIRVERS